MKTKFPLFAMIFIILIQFSCQSQMKDRESTKAPAQSQNFPATWNQQPIPPTTQPPVIKTACYKTTSTICAIEVEIMKQTNEYRVTQGKSELLLGEKLSYSARDWSKTQGDRRRIGHGGFSRLRMNTISIEYGSTEGVRMSSENVAMTSSRGDNPSEVARTFVQMWIKSSGHRRNILSSTNTIGVGVYSNNSGSYYATQIFGSESSDSSIATSEINPSRLVRMENSSPYIQNQSYGLGLYRH